MISSSAVTELFYTNVKEFLKSALQQERLSYFACTIKSSEEMSAVLANGRWHSKFPAQNGKTLATTVDFRTDKNLSAQLHFIGSDFEKFAKNFAAVEKLACALEHKTQVVKRGSYPKIPLASPELLALLDSENAFKALEDLVKSMDSEAAKIAHKNLIGREIGASLAHLKKIYIDSAGNEAAEETAFCSIQMSFSLTDTSEFAFDLTGFFPKEEDWKKVLLEATKNLQNVDVRKLVPVPQGFAVLLTPRAFITLFDELVAPNLSVRTILDGTGAWEANNVHEVVLPNVTVHDDPHVPYSPFSSLFDVEGCPTKKVTILRDGVLEHPLFTSSLLKEFEDAHPEFVGRFDLTGHAESSDSTAPTNTYIEIKGNAALSIEELLGKYPHIAYINSLTGMSLDPLTGQFALDAEGVKIYENGEVRYSTSLTLRGNFFEALRADGNWCGPKERYYYTWAPSLLTRGLDCVPKEMASHE